MNYLPNRSWACLCNKIAELFGRVEVLEAGGGGGSAGTMALQDANNVAITGGSLTDVTVTTGAYSSRVNEAMLHAVRKASAGTIAKGQVVRITGSSGTHLLVELADATDESTSSSTIGVAATSITTTTGWMMVEGELNGLNNVPTASFTNGQALWLSETTGSFTTTRPTQPAHGVFIGWVVEANNGAAGRIFVKVINYQELNELHDVLISGLAGGNVLIYDSVAQLWKNQTPSAITGLDATNISTGTIADARLSSNVALENVVNTFTSAQTVSAAGAASTPAVSVTGTIYTGGTSTTTKPKFLVEPSGTTSTGWATAGSLIASNAPSGFSGRLFEGHLNGVLQFAVNSVGHLFSVGGRLHFGTSSDAILNRESAAVIEMGIDSATPIAQTFKGANARAGTDTNTAGGNLTIAAGRGTGTAAGGVLNLQTSTPTTSGTAAGTLTTRIAISGTSITASLPIVFQSYTVATLPTGVEGMRAYVTDATAPTFLGALTGGGAVKCPVFYNGTAWVAG